jgi:curved DNA-binding protein CbpA
LQAAEHDHYETLQLSANAHPETIQRVYRILARRYHPDNSETGDAELFKQILEAYRTLSDPEKRGSYDARRTVTQRTRWKIFEQAAFSTGVEGERRKRQGVLEVLYSKRIGDPDQPHLSIQEVEELLGCPRDHLQVTLWYLKDKGLIHRTDNGRYSITSPGSMRSRVPRRPLRSPVREVESGCSPKPLARTTLTVALPAERSCNRYRGHDNSDREAGAVYRPLVLMRPTLAFRRRFHSLSR